ncbi:hypothetical protein SJI19_04285 [Acerihabitans sp. TG2]|uniref:hypothetical protein n=1 Tax=Acerihabitans sp. TG2 TaxID=3096008 RepID=UPI002B230178|nr:hypothetical protein [Acerihabitans sp. TG2]MEA9389780.1 hypothetical protein [Acerihabitans sp. TG2]
MSLSRVPATPRVSDIDQNGSPVAVGYDGYPLSSPRPADAYRDRLNISDRLG